MLYLQEMTKNKTPTTAKLNWLKPEETTIPKLSKDSFGTKFR